MWSGGSTADMANHVDQETDVQPEEREANERCGGRDGQPGENQLVCRLKLLDAVHLRTQHLISTQCYSQTASLLPVNGGLALSASTKLFYVEPG